MERKKFLALRVQVRAATTAITRVACLNSAGPRMQQLQPLQGPRRDMQQRRDNVSDVVRPRRGRSLAIAEPGEGHLISIIAAVISFTYSFVALFPSAVTYP